MLQVLPFSPMFMAQGQILAQRFGLIQEQALLPVPVINPVNTGGGGSITPSTPSDPPAYVFTQSTVATLWTINHNLGTFPSVTTTDPNGHVILGQVTYVSSNQVTVAFSQPVSGFAYLNV